MQDRTNIGLRILFLFQSVIKLFQIYEFFDCKYQLAYQRSRSAQPKLTRGLQRNSLDQSASDDAPAPVRLRRPRAQGQSHSGSNSHASSSSQEQNSVPIARARASVPAAPPEFNKSHNDISKSINQMMYSMLKTGYKTYSKVPAVDRELWFRQFANPLIRDVIDLVESQKQEYLASQPLSDDGSSASTSLSRVLVNEMVEEAVPKNKGRLVGLARRASSCPSSSQTPYVDPMIMEDLHKKDDRIVALESQNATILAHMAQQDAQIAEHKAEVAEAS
ncbi:hypothetical protein F2Q70_00039800 [Brassica cretica]|uniref:Uncharacterized protein n=1 Tax=Brassica cretica TaxID=69181 RepID=A0A8S9K1P8_BRACR|nr:hypothetical protein F2Q70_00039800 [Brassica cretica]